MISEQLSKVETSKLRALADLLDTVPAERFDLLDWVGPKSECGFVGCAVGWAAHFRIFPGLKLDYGENHHGGYESSVVYMDGENVWVGWEAVQMLFGLAQEEAVFLFSVQAYDPDYNQPSDVACNLRQFASEVEGRLKLNQVIKLASAA